MLKLKNGYSLLIEPDESGNLCAVVWNPEGAICDRERFSRDDTAGLSKFLALYGA